jgi:hypothetical protein
MLIEVNRRKDMLVRITSLTCVLLFTGCATFREPDPRAADETVRKVKAAPTLKAVAASIEDVRTLYYEQISLLKKDILGSGDQTTNLGIGAGIVAASSGISVDVLKGIGLIAGAIGVYDLRYKPAQQRQYYLDGSQALGCMADRVRQLDMQTSAFAAQASFNTFGSLAGTPAQAVAASAIDGSVEIAYRAVLAVHRRLGEKVFSAVSTQGLTTIRDNLVKESVDAQLRAQEVKTEPAPLPVRVSLASASNLTFDFSKPASDAQGGAARKLELIEKQFTTVLVDGATFKTDMDACAATFLK